MQVLTAGAKKVILGKNEERNYWLRLGLIYLVTWLVTYNDLPLPVRALVFFGLLYFALKSYFNATVIAFLFIYILFYNRFLPGIPGLDPFRILFVPYLFMSLKRPAIRNFPVNKHLIIIVVFSVVSLKFTADLLEFVQAVPLEPGEKGKGIFNMIAGYFDLLATLAFIYFVFTRLTVFEIKKFFNALLLFTLFQAITLLFIVYKNPEVVLDRESLHGTGQFDQSVLWRNPYFGHKNDWGMLFSFVVLILIVRIMSRKKHEAPGSTFLITIMIFCLSAIAISLSRQAYVWTLMGSVLIAFGTKNIRYFVVLLIGLTVIIITQPKFIVDRMNSMVNVSNTEDFKKLNRKVSDKAWEQAKLNWQVQPRMFFTEWEYNFSEGFWNGMLHQQGILGFLFHVYIYIFMLLRYFAFYKHKNKKVSIYGLLGVTLVFLMFFACFNRRSTHFLHYKGYFTQINILFLFMFSYIELVNYAAKKKLVELKYL